MNILVTGNMGYVGSVLTSFLKKNFENIHIVGYDMGYFAHSLTNKDFFPENIINKQYFGDIRNIKEDILEGVDAVIHLAGISNDPIGSEFANVTEEINQKASVKLAKIAKSMGVKNFVFASSCSMYGNANNRPRKETDETNPLTAYARSKIGTENTLKDFDLGNMNFTSLRFATACGWSNRLRLDLVLNDFVACALTTRKISVLSDGTPWRPIIDVEDMSRIISWAMCREKNNGAQFLAVNAGSNSNNYQISKLAEAVSKQIPNTIISINKTALPDKRSYSVDFSLYEKLAPKHQPIVTLNDTISRLKNGLIRIGFVDKNFRNSNLIRLNVLRNHISTNRIDRKLYWQYF
jgi:nucleoside-diphosphate-sugar epimerase